jgi:hypothetical protein
MNDLSFKVKSLFRCCLNSFSRVHLILCIVILLSVCHLCLYSCFIPNYSLSFDKMKQNLRKNSQFSSQIMTNFPLILVHSNNIGLLPIHIILQTRANLNGNQGRKITGLRLKAKKMGFTIDTIIYILFFYYLTALHVSFIFLKPYKKPPRCYVHYNREG